LRVVPVQLGADGGGAAVAGVPHGAAGSHGRDGTETVGRVSRITSAQIVVATPMSDKATKSSKTVSVSERNLQSAALRLLPKNNKLVSPEVEYLRRVLGERATQQQIDEKVLQVRKLPWSEIVHD
jgi:hypothetical protein